MRIVEYIKDRKIIKESAEKIYKSKGNNLKITVIDDGVEKGKIFVNDNFVAGFTFGGAGINLVNIENAEELISAFLDMISDVLEYEKISGDEEEKNGNEEVDMDEESGTEEENEEESKEEEKEGEKEKPESLSDKKKEMFRDML